jgi:hypothetical protein
MHSALTPRSSTLLANKDIGLDVRCADRYSEILLQNLGKGKLVETIFQQLKFNKKINIQRTYVRVAVLY